MRAPRQTLGVLGGMGPAATAEFLRLLAAHVPGTADQHHPRILMLSDPSIPDRTAAVLSGGADPLPHIAEGLATLARWGADLLAVPCNTAHVSIDRIRDRLTVPLVHIVDATLEAAMRLAPGGGWLAATTGTVMSGLYQRRARALGYRLLLPGDGHQNAVHESAALVKAGRGDDAAALFGRVVRALWRREHVPVVAACTELPLAYEAAGLPREMTVSSLDALAAACVDRLYTHETAPRRLQPTGAPA
ncbi:aspartate/glutamate racemase family protein [Sphaerisporangium fuscum]|uniref:aspartate/glutamate racemase family protein n=1 Tax=Sphaerisporangium fuscum TaxID=2835868 RepID=UPI001BDC66A4|nr:amino acid racemase [Sphaerisporangium fuscum]